MHRCRRCRFRCRCRSTPAPRTTGTRRTNSLRKLLAELPVALEIPFPAHGLPPRSEFLSVQQNPDAPACTARTQAGIVLRQPALDVGGPADIGQRAVDRVAAEDIDEAG